MDKIPFLDEYASFVASRVKPMHNATDDLLHAAIGISGEAGELLDAVKKTWVYGKRLDSVNIIEELGDIMFYVQMAALNQNISLANVIELNMVKLQLRYPDGYTDQAALARADKTEGV